MAPSRFLIAGGGGREAAFATRLAEDARLFAVIQHENPLIVDCVVRSGGQYEVGNADDPDTVLEFAKKHAIDYAFINADQPLANGVVDALLAHGIKAIGGTREAARIEWDKAYSISMMQRLCPEFTPFYRVAGNARELDDAIAEFESQGMDVVVKPQGLTGGKGVKVMGEHLPSYRDCTEYASTLLAGRPDEKVLLVEKLDGMEFTLMGITDGTNLVISPASYDYPFRYEGDHGAGTGGMGCFTAPEGMLPFLDDGDLDDCRHIMQKMIDDMRTRGISFSGVLNGGFFKTAEGIRFMEFNGRFGDPEGINTLSVLEGSFSGLLASIWEKRLQEVQVRFVGKASVVKYLVAKEYPDHSDHAVSFTIDEDAIEKLGIRVFFASCIKTGPHQYRTLKKSRVVALAAVSDTVEDASDRINGAIDSHVTGKLEYRRDIGSPESLDGLRAKSAAIGC